MGVENAALGEAHDETGVDQILREGGPAIGGHGYEMRPALSVGVVDNVVVRQDLLVVAVLAPLGVGLHGLAEAGTEVGGFGHVDIGVPARQAVGEERYIDRARGIVHSDGGVGLVRVGDAAGSRRDDGRGAEGLAAVG